MSLGVPRLVVVESPYWHEDPTERERRLRYARGAMLDCFERGEAPFASHLLYPQVFPDDDEKRAPGARETGLRAAAAWCVHAEVTAVYEDLGITPGMQRGIREAERVGRAIVLRRLHDFWKGRDVDRPCLCRSIQIADGRRHFQGCPQREPLP